MLVLRPRLYSNCHNVNVSANATAVGGIYGYSHTAGGYDGGKAEYVRVPFADVGPALVPDWMSDEDAVLLNDALRTGYFGAQLGDISEGDTVVVFGAGPVGLTPRSRPSSWAPAASWSSTTCPTDWRRRGPIFSAVKLGDAVNKGLTLRMNQTPVKRQWLQLFEHVRNGHLTPSEIVTHRFPLEHIAEGYHVFSAKLDGCIKPLVVPAA